jgi:hypothetical protein
MPHDLRDQPRLSRRRENRPDIVTPTDTLTPRAKFAREILGVSERGLQKYDLKTATVGVVVYVPLNHSLQVVADTVKSRNPPQRRRAVRP